MSVTNALKRIFRKEIMNKLKIRIEACHARTHAYTHARTHTRTHAHTYTYTDRHTDTHARKN